VYLLNVVPVQFEMDSEAEAVVVTCILIEEEKRREEKKQRRKGEESVVGFTISTGRD
jgi:hypothetical protein